jgi:hypothetical protein
MQVVGDPAAWASDFRTALDRISMRLDARPDNELRRVAQIHPDPMMREQALYEYADRNKEDALSLLCEAVAKETDQQVRWDALWAIEKR